MLAAALGKPELMASGAGCLLLAVFVLIKFSKKRPPTNEAQLSLERLSSMLRGVELLQALGEPEIAAAVQALETQTFRKGDVIFSQDSQGDLCFFMVAGECCATSQVHSLEEGLRVHHMKHGVGTVVEVTQEPSITKVVFDKGENHRYTPASLHKLKPVADVKPRVVEVQRYRPGPGGHHFFGERALSRVEPRATTVTCLTDVTVLRLTAATFLALKRQQDRTYLLTYLLTYVRTYVRTYVLTYLRTYVLTYLRTYVLTYLRTYLLTYLRQVGLMNGREMGGRRLTVDSCLKKGEASKGGTSSGWKAEVRTGHALQ